MASAGWRRWRDAMDEALYGPAGFYRTAGAPAGHFRTSAHASPQWARAVASLAQRVGGPTVVEIGAGGGELLRALAELLPDAELVGVDVAPRPPRLPARVEWRPELPDSIDGLLLAVEWLDVVPVDVVELTDDGVRYVEVSLDGSDRLGAAVDADDAGWLERWWPIRDVGDRAEVGRSRDVAWADAVGRLRRGVALAVDYAVDPQRDVAGTLTGYRSGRQVLPVPDGTCDLTAHVLLASCAGAVAGVSTHLVSQRDALKELGVDGRLPSYAGDPRGYLTALQSAGEAAELLDRDGLGAFTWLVQARGVALPV